jgi:zinc/manganese transport system ATP-binding protein
VTDNALRFESVAAVRRGATVWTDGTFAIPQGAVVGLIGPNGSGKTTMLEIILGMIKPASGNVNVLGGAPKRGNDQIGYVPQNFLGTVADAITCHDLVMLGLVGSHYGISRPTADQQHKVQRSLKSVGALDIADQRLSHVSGGQQQRVAIAQALVNAPRLLLLDEPLANLDMRSQQEIALLIGEIAKNTNTTIVLVTHDLNPLLSVLTGAIYLLDSHPHYDQIGNVVDEELLSHLYGTDIRVVRTPQGDLFTRSA